MQPLLSSLPTNDSLIWITHLVEAPCSISKTLLDNGKVFTSEKDVSGYTGVTLAPTNEQPRNHDIHAGKVRGLDALPRYGQQIQHPSLLPAHETWC